MRAPVRRPRAVGTLVAALSALLIAAGAAAQAGRLTVVNWNVESGGAQVGTITQRIRAFQGVDLWGFEEVLDSTWAQSFEVAAEVGENADFRRVLGTTGGEDRLLVLYNSARFDLLGTQELMQLNIGGHVRAPLIARLRDRQTGTEFLFMVNHLYRSNTQARRDQARGLNQWAQSQTLPVIAVGDYNFDWSVVGGDTQHDAGFDLMTQGGAFTWVRPATLVRSECAPQYDSVLDFAFVTAPARAWPATSEIVVAPGDCPDGPTKPDHRPVRTVFTLPSAPPLVATLKAQILQRLDSLAAELQRLRQLVQQLP